MNLDFVRLEIGGPVGWLEYARAPVNAFNHQMVAEVHEALRALLAQPEVRVVVLASALPRYFSSGADLKVFEGMTAGQMAEWVDMCHALVRELRASPKPVLAAINGVAVGGGLEMTLHADLRFAAADARLGQPEVNIGFIPPVGGTQGLARLLGRPRALRLLYDGGLLTAAEALAVGLVDEVVEPAALREQVRRYAEGLAQKPADALAAIRRCVAIGGALPFEDGLAVEREAAVGLAGGANFQEGVRSFLAKRKPAWR
jgi:enoyl-CoA hydratase/carnithine racemase